MALRQTGQNRDLARQRFEEFGAQSATRRFEPREFADHQQIGFAVDGLAQIAGGFSDTGRIDAAGGRVGAEIL